MNTNPRYYKSTLVDFPDDTETSVFRPEDIDLMMSELKAFGFKRVYWIHYGDESYGLFWAKGVPEWRKCAETAALIKDPIGVAVRAARRHGLEIYALFKPYETGVSYVYPEGSPQAEELGLLPHLGGRLPAMMHFVKDHPHLRIKRRTDDIPADPDRLLIRAITLYKADDAPTRIRKEHIRIWTSDDNYRYALKELAFEFADRVVPAPRDFIDLNGETLAAKSAPVRALTLAGLDIADKYVIVATEFADGEPDFANAAQEMIQAFTVGGEELPISIGIEHRVYAAGEFDYTKSGIVFDDGFGRKVVRLDQPGPTGKGGFIAIARGRNAYLPTALCEAYPEVRAFWLNMVRECLDAGVDGVDFRIENHGMHTNDPFAYGYNAIIVEEYSHRHGAVASAAEIDPQLLAEIRGEYYTMFLREANALLKSRGKKMQVHLNVEFFRPDPPVSRRLAYPWNIRFDWRGWIEEGLLDEATLRTFQFTPEFVLGDAFSNEVIEACRARGIPLHYTRYCYLQPAEQFAEEMKRIAEDGRFESLIVYEVAGFMRLDDNTKKFNIVNKTLGDIIKNG